MAVDTTSHVVLGFNFCGAGDAHPHPKLRIVQEPQDVVAQLVDRADRGEQARCTVREHFWNATDACGHDRLAKRHRFEQGDGKALEFRCHQKHVHRAHQATAIGAKARHAAHVPKDRARRHERGFPVRAARRRPEETSRRHGVPATRAATWSQSVRRFCERNTATVPTTRCLSGNIQLGSNVATVRGFGPDLLNRHAVQQCHDVRALPESATADRLGDFRGDRQHAAVPSIGGGVRPLRDRVIALLQIVFGIHDRNRRPSAGEPGQDAGDRQVGLDDIETLALLEQRAGVARPAGARSSMPMCLRVRSMRGYGRCAVPRQ